MCNGSASGVAEISSAGGPRSFSAIGARNAMAISRFIPGRMVVRGRTGSVAALFWARIGANCLSDSCVISMRQAFTSQLTSIVYGWKRQSLTGRMADSLWLILSGHCGHCAKTAKSWAVIFVAHFRRRLTHAGSNGLLPNSTTQSCAGRLRPKSSALTLKRCKRFGRP